MKKYIPAFLTVAAVTTAGAHAAAADVTGAVAGIAADASSGVVAGVTVGAVVFGARVVWRAVKSMAG